MALDPRSSTTRALLFWASLVETYNERLREFAWGEGHINACMEGIICIKITSRMHQAILYVLEIVRVLARERLWIHLVKRQRCERHCSRFKNPMKKPKASFFARGKWREKGKTSTKARPVISLRCHFTKEV